MHITELTDSMTSKQRQILIIELLNVMLAGDGIEKKLVINIAKAVKKEVRGKDEKEI